MDVSIDNLVEFVDFEKMNILIITKLATYTLNRKPKFYFFTLPVPVPTSFPPPPPFPPCPACRRRPSLCPARRLRGRQPRRRPSPRRREPPSLLAAISPPPVSAARTQLLLPLRLCSWCRHLPPVAPLLPPPRATAPLPSPPSAVCHLSRASNPTRLSAVLPLRAPPPSPGREQNRRRHQHSELVALRRILTRDGVSDVKTASTFYRLACSHRDLRWQYPSTSVAHWMIYTGIDTFYLTEEQLKSSPSRKDGIDEETETTLRIYGCDLIQESGILLKLPQAVMATGQVLFHRFYCKKSFARFSVKRVAASCVWLASKLEECPKKAKHVIVVFHRMECRRENLPIEPFDFHSKKYTELKNDLVRTEGHLLKEMGFICHVEHPHKFISNYLATLDAPPEMRQEAWNLANDSLRTTLCVRFKSEVVACGVVYAASRRFQVSLPESPPWWEVFDADKDGIDEVCRVLAHLYSLPKAQCIAVYKDNDSFTSRSKNPDQQAQAHKESPLNGEPKETSTPKSEAPTPDGSLSKETTVKAAQEKMEVNNTEGDTRNVHADVDTGGESTVTPKVDQKVDIDRNRDRDRERTRTRERDSRARDSDYDSRSRDLDRDRERDKDLERERERRHHRAKDKGSGHSDKLRHHSSRDRSDYYSSRSTREKDRYEKDRHRHHPYS